MPPRAPRRAAPLRKKYLKARSPAIHQTDHVKPLMRQMSPLHVVYTLASAQGYLREATARGSHARTRGVAGSDAEGPLPGAPISSGRTAPCGSLAGQQRCPPTFRPGPGPSFWRSSAPATGWRRSGARAVGRGAGCSRVQNCARNCHTAEWISCMSPFGGCSRTAALRMKPCASCWTPRRT